MKCPICKKRELLNNHEWCAECSNRKCQYCGGRGRQESTMLPFMEDEQMCSVCQQVQTREKEVEKCKNK